MWRPHDIRMSQRSNEVVLARLNYYDEEKGPDLLWSVISSLFAYPLPSLMKDLSYISTDIRSNSELPFRARTRKPIWHPTLKDHRLCPNFPELCIDITGNIRPVRQPEIRLQGMLPELRATVGIPTKGEYVLTRIPGRAVPQLVSLVQIYGDAWSIDGSPTVELDVYSPANGDYTDLSPKNIRLVTREKRGRYRDYRNLTVADYETYPINPLSPLIMSEQSQRIVSKNAITLQEAAYNEYDCFYVENAAGRTMYHHPACANYNWYMNSYWAICHICWESGLVQSFTTLAECSRVLKWSRRTIRLFLRNQTPENSQSLFLL